MKKFNKRLLSAMACAGVLATVASSSGIISIAKSNQVQAASINDYILNNNLQYGGLQVLPSTFTEDFAYRYGKPEGIVIHETATPGATAANEATYFRREWSNMYSYVHAFVDKSGVIQIHPTNRGVWGAGAIANPRFIQVELCEESTTDGFARSVNNDAIYVASLLKQYGLTPSLADGTGSGTIWSHNAVSQYLGGTDHTDPIGYFNKWGYSMSQFFDLVKHYYYGSAQAASTEKAGTTSNDGNPAVKVTYTSAIAEWKNPGSGVVGYLQVGASQSVVGKAQVNGKWWYKLSSGNWVPGEYVYVTGLSQIPTISATNESATINVNNQSTNVKIKYISGYSIAVWSTPGANPTGKYLKDGTTVQTVGYTTVNGKKWYKLSDNEWIPAEYTEEANTSSSSNETGSVIVNYISGYSIAVWSTPGANPTGKYIADGTSVKYYATTSYKGQTWYKIGENQWIPGQYVKASNTSGSLTVTYTAGYSIAVWSNPGSGVTGKYLKNGTTVKYFDAKNYNGQTWYKIGENQWVPAQYVSVN
ncbi:SLAP domain-containing protein [Lactobacillus mulieris]|uniref:peptidoglycan recognition protein family protein n=1 Tax=Lactobacillus mulieris TaxID=2508708 RepID=UPI001F30EAFB|nr:N-acetylmuramoyl-L-alanine amidase [Lactobacillus mulieris]MCF1783343.1 SLAP domain-containing protein [Lactobacillus mulieris]MCW8104455.1 SLAP domain-containing protein [Lactobacillus mulieris]